MMRAGYIQFNPVLGNQKKNIRVLSGLLDKAIGTDLMVIPELANSGYNFETKEQAFSLAENLGNSLFLKFLEEKARKLKMYIVSGINELDNGLLYNTATLVGPEGYIGKYRKMHLFMNEFDFFEKGNLGLPVFDIGKCKIGILICFDWVFPEVWRILALKGADVICHPSNLVLPFAQQAVPVHGLINKTYVITANRFGTEREITFSGQSFISDTEGKTLAKAPSDKNEVRIMDLDILKSRNKMITQRNHVMNDRLPEEYGDLISKIKY
jgi:predicted amidohydrolase